MTIYNYSATLRGQQQALSAYEGQVLLIVNTASQCGFTPQYTGLQNLYETYKNSGFTVLGFPCNQFGNQEPGSDAEIESFCQVNFGVTFPLFDKVDVKGPSAHPLFQYLTQNAHGLFTKDIKWNFTKFLINPYGEVIKRFSPTTTPEKIEKEIQKQLQLNVHQ